MRIGLFVDVDGVLTWKPINVAIAEALEVQHELLPLEKQFDKGGITSEYFGNELCRIFRKAGFTRSWVKTNWAHMPLSANYRNLLTSGLETFLVSSGPSYFIEILADEVGISLD